MTNKEYWYWLCNIDNIGLKKIQTLIDYFMTPEQVFYAKEDELKQFSILSETDIGKIIISKDSAKIQDAYAKLSEKGIYFVTIEDKEYPRKLLNIFQPPFALYYKGSLPREGEKSMAIIGARNCSEYGKEVTKYLSSQLARAGLQIISGLARGIDGYAHEGALAVSGYTYAVEGCGIDICYPKENISLYMDMQLKGGVISEYAPGVYPNPGNFPMRNRIISGLSDGILVIEAKEKSGSLITVDMGLEQGKNIYALPGRSCDLLSRGCNNLIKMGAKLVSGVEDILEDFAPKYEKNENELKNYDKLLETEEKIVYACLSLMPKHLNEIAFEANMDIIKLSEILFNLELKNYIKQNRKNYYSYIT
ncbi:MAG: hypothetical protein K0R21_1114 [Anaerocolumna sp.]|jgi:DNA processing protein|nr:hypothetical protein [Anaerocolumna sp.]